MNKNTEWKTLTPDAFPKTFEDIYISDMRENIIAYRSSNAYIIAVDREHMPETCDNVCKSAMGLDDGKYIIRIFYAEHTVWTDPETGAITHEQKAFYSADGMMISIDDENIEYCKYKRLETESLLS